MLPRRALVGMVHLAALPGSPGARRAVDRIAAQAADEARALAECGFDGIIVENMHDRPYVRAPHGPETVAAMTVAARAVRAAAPRATLGIQVLSNGEREALAIALAVGADFVRCENFVFAHVGDEGLMSEAAAGPLLRYRRAIGAGGVRVLCDVKKKHASHAITGDVSLGEAARAAEFFLADGVIVTGVATGRPAAVEDVREARGATRLPVVVGSGVTAEQVAPLFEAGADALIVGSSIKRGGRWDRPVDPARCRALARAVREARR